MIVPRFGDWMQTFTGRQFWPLDPRPEEIFVEDVAHALSMQCRYAGHCRKFYSVAEHCVLLAEAVAQAPGATTDDARWALMHDASEAYLVDVPRPVKPHLTGYRDAEAVVMAAVAERFGLPDKITPLVHDYDNRIIADERANLSDCAAKWDFDELPLCVTLRNWAPTIAETRFLMAFDALFPEIGR